MSGSIIVRGARVHNLKNIKLEIPLNSFTVVTGVSGSGKSSLAFDTIYAEGQRRYVESLSAYVRQFLERIERPEVDEISGICPAISIRQKSASRNPRSTVGTVTEIYDFLRLLYARIGKTFCRQCGRRVSADSPESAADLIAALPEGTRLYLLAPLPAIRQEGAAEFIDYLRAQGYTRLFVRGRVLELDSPEAKLAGLRDGYLLVDRLKIGSGLRQRLVDSLETCFREGNGRAQVLLLPDAGRDLEKFIVERFTERRAARLPAGQGEGLLLKFSERFECQHCAIQYERPEPRLFSFNNPFGACPRCQGFGNTIGLDLDLVIPDKSRTLAQGAIEPWTKPRYRGFQSRLRDIAQRRGVPLDVPFEQLSPEHKKLVIEGIDGFPGVLGFFDLLEEKKYKMYVRMFLSRYRGYSRCPECGGERLRREARDVLVGDRRITEVCRMGVEEAAHFFDKLKLHEHEIQIAGRILYEIRRRLGLLIEAGLEYLTLDRLSSTLSGGESQRIQLATALGSTLVGTLYILDEPSIGLHVRDTLRLIEILRHLRDMGNTVLVVEHDPEIIRAADHVIDLGPGAGEHGGEVVYSGGLDGLLDSKQSLTGKYLRGELRIAVPVFRRRGNGTAIEVLGAREHNLKNIDARIPLGMMVCVTGVSGSGKSTLVHDVLYNGLLKIKGPTKEQPPNCRAIRGAEHISEVVLVDQTPIGKTPRSNPVTYIGAFDDIRMLFAATKDAQSRNYSAGHFSFNIPGGRCEACQGSGTVTVEMQFLPDVELPCEECKGTRYKGGILEVKYRGKNIHEVLNLTVREALAFFASSARLVRKLKVLDDVGLGYLRLGQSGTTLSGGEAQRIKLAYYLGRSDLQKTLYIFDEPTTGLHLDDIQKLLSTFNKLIAAGASLLVIEHNLEVIKTADWIIDLGPEGGERGGRVVASGTPEEVARIKQSHTGRYLARLL